MEDYSETLFLSITGTANLAKFYIIVMYNKKNILQLKNKLFQKEFLSTDDIEVNWGKKYEKFIRL